MPMKKRRRKKKKMKLKRTINNSQRITPKNK